MTDTRDILAAALCDAVNWPGTWETMHREARTSWRHRADKVIGELAQRGYVIVALKELDGAASLAPANLPPKTVKPAAPPLPAAGHTAAR